MQALPPLTPDLSAAFARCQAPVEQAHSLPPACYRSAGLCDVEATTVFGGWIGVGRADMVREPGDYIALDILGHAIILLRDGDGVLRAYANACRHRGARLVDGTGNCRGLKCPFHAWAYRLDGTLAAAPRMDEAEGFCKGDYGLHAYAAEERLGFAFISLAPPAQPLDDALGDFADIHAPWPLAGMVTTRREVLEVDCNWKAFLEVFNEYYHLPFVHRDSIDAVYHQPDPAEQTTGAYATQFGATEGTGGLLERQQNQALPPIPQLKGRAASGVRYTWVFPNMTFAAGTDALWVYEAYPLGPDRCKVVQSACFPPETLALSGSDTKIAAYHERLDAALAEDIPALENQQRGLRSPAAVQGRFQPLLEPNVASFANWYATKMTGDARQR